MAAPNEARALHYVFRVLDRDASYKFYTSVLGMRVLRHEEFQEQCKASCNGPYDGMWSKTMVGYGPEDEHFVLELTYNYEVSEYRLGNDFKGIHIESDEVLAKVQASQKSEKLPDGTLLVRDPDGHCFFVSAGSSSKHPVRKVAVNVSDLNESKEYWSVLMGMRIESGDKQKSVLSYGPEQCKLELNQLDWTKLDRGTAFGRIAFATATQNLKTIQEKVRDSNPNLIHTELTSLETPGKATVHVVILYDPDEHEICFVGEEGFQQLSKVDPGADEAIRQAIGKDNSHGKAGS